MKKLVFIFAIILGFHQWAKACSMYKVTVGNKTIVGCNEDAWRTQSKIWFETAKTVNEYGAGFTGSRQVGPNSFAPQSAMNTQGLVFSRLGSFHPVKNTVTQNAKPITDPIFYLKDILHQCKNVTEVKAYIEQFDHSIFIDDVFIYIDKTGNYLVVEPYKLIEGTDSQYVLSNFCPSLVNKQYARKLDRYRNGEDFLKKHTPTADLEYFKSLSDTMSVCRSRNGDGTLLTTIWDSEKGTVNLYFYHDYDSTLQFDLANELSKGDHIIDIVKLFPHNAEFEQLNRYFTPFNVPPLRIGLVLFAGLFFVSSFIFIFSFFKNKSRQKYAGSKLGIAVLGFILTGFLFVLATEIGIYYFDAPYTPSKNSFLQILSYTPFVVLLTIIPIYILNFKLIKEPSWAISLKGLLGLNTLAYTIFLGLFAYWGLFNVFH